MRLYFEDVLWNKGKRYEYIYHQDVAWEMTGQALQAYGPRCESGICLPDFQKIALVCGELPRVSFKNGR